MADDFYALLDVGEDASQDEIKTAFREKVQEYHPDHNDDPRASAQFTALRKAYDTLKDPVERQSYDRMGHLDYVAKRMDGLPDPEKWAPSEVDGDADAGADSSGVSGTAGTGGTTGSTAGSSRSSTGRSSASGTGRGSTGGSGAGSTSNSRTSSASTTGSSTRSGSGSSTRSGSGSSRSGTGSSTAGGSSGHGSSGTSSTSGGVSGTATSGRSSNAASSAGASGTASTSTGTASERSTATTTGGSTTETTASDGAGTATRHDAVQSWIAGNGVARRVVGWPLLLFVALLYGAGIGAFGYANAAAASDLWTGLAGAGTDAGALAAAVADADLPVAYEFVATALSDAMGATTIDLAAAVLLGLGAIVLPAVTFLLVYLTRGTSGWKPTYLYVLLTLGPIAGVAAGAATAAPRWAELGLIVVLPAIGLLAMLLSAYVRPKVLGLLGR